MMLDLSHKKLIAWQKAFELLPILYSLCEKLPVEERFNLTGQMKRAGLSISNSLAEGSSRKSKIEKNRFFEIARTSVVEIDNCLVAAVVLKFLTNEDIKEVALRIIGLFRLISGLIDSNNSK